MKLKVGEKVRFLNEAIEGVVSGLLSNDRVEVTDEFGFTHTAPEKYLVRVEFHLDEDYEPAPMTHEKPGPEKASAPRLKSYDSIVSSLDEDETVYAAVSLINGESPLSSDLQLKLVNNCSISIAYTVSKKIEEMRMGVSAGVLKPKQETVIGVYSQDELHRFSGFIFSFLFYEEGIYKPRPAAEKSLKFSSSDFVEGENWDVIRHRDQKTLLMPLYMVGRDTDLDLQKLIEKFETQQEEIEKRKQQPSSTKKKKSEKFVILNKEKTVDLHIESLLKDYTSMSNAQIISHQLKTFQFEMDQAILNHYYKVTFIHGVGEGILKSAIREELKKYSGIRFAEAPYEKFGHGATEVIFS